MGCAQSSQVVALDRKIDKDIAGIRTDLETLKSNHKPSIEQGPHDTITQRDVEALRETTARLLRKVMEMEETASKPVVNDTVLQPASPVVLSNIRVAESERKGAVRPSTPLLDLPNIEDRPESRGDLKSPEILTQTGSSEDNFSGEMNSSKLVTTSPRNTLEEEEKTDPTTDQPTTTFSSELESLRIELSQAKYDLHASEMARSALRRREGEERLRADAAEGQIAELTAKLEEEKLQKTKLEVQMVELSRLVSELKEVHAQQHRQLEQENANQKQLQHRQKESAKCSSSRQPNHQSWLEGNFETEKESNSSNGNSSQVQPRPVHLPPRGAGSSSARSRSSSTNSRSNSIVSQSSLSQGHERNPIHNIFSSKEDYTSAGHEGQVQTTTLPGAVSVPPRPRSQRRPSSQSSASSSDLLDVKADLERRKAEMIRKMQLQGGGAL